VCVCVCVCVCVYIYIYIYIYICIQQPSATPLLNASLLLYYLLHCCFKIFAVTDFWKKPPKPNRCVRLRKNTILILGYITWQFIRPKHCWKPWYFRYIPKASSLWRNSKCHTVLLWSDVIDGQTYVINNTVRPCASEYVLSIYPSYSLCINGGREQYPVTLITACLHYETCLSVSNRASQSHQEVLSDRALLSQEIVRVVL
jgi:hypothetical protein